MQWRPWSDYSWVFSFQMQQSDVGPYCFSQKPGSMSWRALLAYEFLLRKHSFFPGAYITATCKHKNMLATPWSKFFWLWVTTNRDRGDEPRLSLYKVHAHPFPLYRITFFTNQFTKFIELMLKCFRIIGSWKSWHWKRKS